MSNTSTKKNGIFCLWSSVGFSTCAWQHPSSRGEGELSNLPVFREPKKRQKNHGRDEGACDGKGQLGRWRWKAETLSRICSNLKDRNKLS